MNDIETIQQVLNFWFEETTGKQKFIKDPKFDAVVKEKFESVYEDIVDGKTEPWKSTPEGRLAEIIVLDQFARNMFRDTPKCFSGDSLALQLAKEAIMNGDDKKVSEDRRVFFYMPYMHSESKKVHIEAVKIFIEHGSEMNLKYEIKHKDIIDRFGRYPHRNVVLGRVSTSEEIEWLEKGGGF